ncbi:MAG: hypothetical protein KY476_07405 [Planctomycetes bacterium]|nr:hypothetical protein [Planctomycetota bacterium]
MMHFLKAVGSSAFLAALALGCGGGDDGDGANAGAESGGSAYVLNAEPAAARGVTDVRKAAKDGDEVTVVGRIGGSADPFVKDLAAFTIVDPKLKPCSPEEGCPRPWDYCCTFEGLAEGTAMVQIVDDGGQLVSTDARKLLPVKELSTVVVRGKAKVDPEGNLTVRANQLYVRK